MNRYNAEDMTTAIGYFRSAVDLDPEYALAWASLSFCYLDQGANGWVPFAEGAERARETARRALEVEPELAAGHWALGSVHMYYDWDWKSAETCIRRALRLAPDDSLLIVRAANLLLNLGQVDEAAALVARALALDPLNAAAHLRPAGWRALPDAGQPSARAGRPSSSVRNA
jgi:tetratricopeptide (TPR) repeat protein